MYIIYIYIYIYIYYSFVITDIWLVQIDVMEARKWCDNSLDYLSVGIYVLNKTKEANFDAFNIIAKKKKKKKRNKLQGSTTLSYKCQGGLQMTPDTISKIYRDI